MPMELRFNTDSRGEAVGLTGGDIDMMASGLSLKAFEGKSWYDAVEGVLAALGMTMRFTDDGSVTVMHLANLPLYGNTQFQPALEAVFHGGSKTLVPAYKEIISEVDFGAQEECDLDIYAGVEFTGEEREYSFAYESITLPAGGVISGSGQAPWDKIAGSASGWDLLSAMFDPSKYEIGYFLSKSEGASAKDYVFLVANQTSGQQQFYSFDTSSLDVRFIVEFAQSPLTIERGKLEDAYANLSKIEYAVMVEANGITKYWDGYDWKNSYKLVTAEFDAQNSASTNFEISLRSCKDITTTAKVTVVFDKIIYKPLSAGVETGVYARVKSIKIGVTAAMLETDKVKTINNEAYNVKAERNLAVGALSKSVAYLNPLSYINALWDTTNQGELYPFPYQVEFGSGNESYPLPVMVHRQLLMFHHVAHPMLSGDCSVVGGRIRFDRQYRYKGTMYLLQGGTLDFVSGMLNGVMLRGFIRYQQLWDGVVVGDFSIDYNSDFTTVILQ